MRTNKTTTVTTRKEQKKKLWQTSQPWDFIMQKTTQQRASNYHQVVKNGYFNGIFILIFTFGVYVYNRQATNIYTLDDVRVVHIQIRRNVSQQILSAILSFACSSHLTDSFERT